MNVEKKGEGGDSVVGHSEFALFQCRKGEGFIRAIK